MEIRQLLQDSMGNSLVEFMVVVAIAAIMGAASYAGYSSMMDKEKVKAAATQLVGHLKEARTLALEKHMSHSVVFSGNQYTVFSDVISNNPSGSFYRDPSNPQERVVHQVDVSTQYRSLSIASSDNVRFDVSGMPRNTSNGFGAGTIKVQDTKGRYSQVVFSMLGRVMIDECPSDDDLCIE